MATSMGHLDQERQGLQSTKAKALDHIMQQELSPDVKQDFFPSTPQPTTITNDCVATILPYIQSHKAFMDLTRRFLHRSSRGKAYILVVYDYDSNAILAEALLCRQAGEIRRGWECIHQQLKTRGVEPNLYVLDNEISGEFKNALNKYEVE